MGTAQRRSFRLDAFPAVNIASEFLSFNTHNSIDSLTTLTLPAHDIDRLAWNLSSFPNLSTLRIRLNPQPPRKDLDRYFLLMNGIASAATLHNLKFKLQGDEVKDFLILDDVNNDFFRRLPSTLRTLHLGALNISDQQLVEAFGDSALLPNLHRVVLSCARTSPPPRCGKDTSQGVVSAWSVWKACVDRGASELS